MRNTKKMQEMICCFRWSKNGSNRNTVNSGRIDNVVENFMKIQNINHSGYTELESLKNRRFSLERLTFSVKVLITIQIQLLIENYIYIISQPVVVARPIKPYPRVRRALGSSPGEG